MEKNESTLSKISAEEDIDRITAMPEPVLRNLLITQCYSQLSNALAKRITAGANWCTFATWASRQAGQTIRAEDLRKILHAFLQQQPNLKEAVSVLALLAEKTGARSEIQTIREAIFSAIVDPAAKRASDAVSRGNKKVFEEIAREFARFIHECFNDKTYDNSHINTWCEKLKAGPPPDGQEYLGNAFKKYYSMMFEPDAKKCAEGTFFANLLIGFHEQTRLQPEIEESLNTAIDKAWIKKRLVDELLSKMNWWKRIVQFFREIFQKPGLLDHAIDAVASKAQYHLRQVMTAHFMIITLPPDNRLHLGKDLSASFPENLQKLNDTELMGLLAKIDATANSLEKSGATDWGNLGERMHYITDMFRCYHEDSYLFEEVFTKEQLEEIEAGKLPGGILSIF